MKSFAKLLAVAVALAVPTLAAHADPLTGGIGVGPGSGGSDTFDGTGVTFNASNAFINLATGSFAPLLNSSVTLSNLVYANPGILVTLGSGATLDPNVNFTVTSDQASFANSSNSVYSTTYASGDNLLSVSGTGNFDDDGVDTAAMFSITSSTNNVTTFEITAAPTVAPTPEPSSLLLIGTGLLGSAGMLYRRNRASVS